MKNPEASDEEEDEFLEIKNPFLANLFHYGMIVFILVIVFLIFGGLLFSKSGGRILSLFIGGILGVTGIIRWIKSNKYYDEDKGGF